MKATARVCSSIISLSMHAINFGDCSIGTRKTSLIQVFNHSDLPATIRLNFKSKCIRFVTRSNVVGQDLIRDENGPFIILPKQVILFYFILFY